MRWVITTPSVNDSDELSQHEKKKYWIKALEEYVEYIEGVALSQGIRLHEMQSMDVDSYDMRDDGTTKVRPILRTKGFGICRGD